MPRGATFLASPPVDAAPLSWRNITIRRVLYPVAGLACGLFHAIRTLSPMAPSVANPYFEGGGLAGYSHSHILSLITAPQTKNLVLPWVVVRVSPDKTRRNEDVLGCVAKAKLTYPLVARPDTESSAAGLCLLRNEQDLKAYAGAFPKGERFIVHQAVRPALIAHLYYERRPDVDVGQIVSLAFSYYPFVTGDGTHTVQELVLTSALWRDNAAAYLAACSADWNVVVPEGEQYRLTRVGADMNSMITQDARDLITPALQSYWDMIFRALPEFYDGCVTIGLQDKNDVETGQNATLLNISGPGIYPHVLDTDVTIIEALKTIEQSARNAYDIGLINKKRGHKPDNFLYVLAMWLKQIALRAHYPVLENH